MGQAKKRKGAGNAAEASKELSSETKTTKALKPKPKIVKKSQNHVSANTEAEGTPKSQKKKAGKAKGTEGQVNDKDKTTNALENNKEKGIINEKPKEKSQSDLMNREKSQSDLKNKEKSHRDLKNDAKSESDQKNREKSDHENKEKSQSDQKIKEKLGGLIFMCNRKTKPECFHYMVMGLPASKHELVTSIKPGLKLFLYDFDLRLLYGIYTASSSGGMKLEPAAFNGAFPAQVRFKVHKDCIPLPEDVFKKAIKENYDAKRNKFKTELTVQQVKNLSELFRPATAFPSIQHSLFQNPAPASIILGPPMPIVPLVGIPESRREALPQVHNELLSRNQYPNNEARRYYLPPPDYGREEHPRHDASMHIGTIPMRREAIPVHGEGIRRDPLPLSEKEYRAFGLAKRPTAPVPGPGPAPSLDPYRSGRDQYNPYLYGTASSDPYHLPPRRDTFPTDMSEGGTDLSRKRPDGVEYNMHRAGQQVSTQSAVSHLGHPYGVSTRAEMAYEGQSLDRTRAGEAERVYTAHAATALSDYNSRLQQLGGRPDVGSLPVSSRYSFAGPSLSYR
ncbi:uncharacterized protein LOC131226310 [Magnolia sinica]|uniref:uncharacterized protein LOC131226310 n=1 Tax=Magnolia sinica TaxID=86752 RepID=UPI00265A3B3B|nr:uncharacterized protein LOC131226310 [Magnolia sinica]XP_058078101.1 uncharacterized protein LOC131226310 [Magnolia sinica]XP_058078103.1 uncharacterized protein LOC131226310 [Magnolia sinica]XP_058078104.1 uncharacterized protein LOC131226310 [Magnolia sinica]